MGQAKTTLKHSTMPSMLIVKMGKFKEFEKDLRTFNRVAFRHATKDTLNELAFRGMQIARGHIQRKMVLRNNWTRGSIQFRKTTALPVHLQVSSFGSTEEYMADQEFGGVKRTNGKVGVPITTSFAAGQEGQRPRTKVAKSANQMRNIQLRKGGRKGLSKKAKNASAISQAAGSGNKLAYLEFGRTKGIFRIEGGKRNPSVKMIQDLSRKSITIKPNPWLAPSHQRTLKQMPRIYRAMLQKQITRANLFKNR